MQIARQPEAGSEYAIALRLVWLYVHSSCTQSSAMRHYLSIGIGDFLHSSNKDGEINMTRNLSAPWADRAISGAIAGIVGGLAHAAINGIDRRVLTYNADDLLLLGGVFSDDTRVARIVGLGMHLNFAAIFGATYAIVLKPGNDNDAMKKGLGFALVEHVGLFPLGIMVDKYHPYVKSGECDPFFTWTSFVEASLRHIALGLGVGASYPTILRFVHANLR